MQHQRRADVAGFVQSLLDADAVVTDGTIRFEASRQQISQFASETKTNIADSTAAGRMLAQKLNGGSSIFDSFGFVQSFIERKSLLPFFVGLIGQLHAAFLSPKQIGTDG